MKKILSLILAISIFISCSAFAAVDISETTKRADALKALGLFKGTENGYDLESNATRVQIAVTLTRLLGKEEKALYQNNGHPFGDVPDWASPYIGWLYENYMINGIDNYNFGTDYIAEPKQFVAMILRTLGYSDTNALDFYYESAVDFAVNIGLIPYSDIAIYKSDVLTRKMMVDLQYKALSMPIKNSRRTLAQKLCNDVIISEAIAESVGIAVKPNPADIFADVPELYGNLYAKRKGSSNRVVCSLDSAIEEYAIRIYCSVDNGAYTEIPRDYGSSMYFEYGELSWRGAAGYVSDFTVHGVPNNGSTYKFILLKTSSTGNIYDIFGKSKEATLR
ncbi:MAG: hypothetical protein IJC74_03495 [Clostridia bacterium]|nr:hypothetical protein [Clostridia bacterium]